jgi:pyruvate/2-oxoglutarate dehydrogenase complex dihydrolipoamide dehydrogenase (E3) component
MNPDLLVIGGGTAALAAARTARRLGRSVVMVTDGEPGGDCTFTGCVPSKTLLESGDLEFTQAMDRVRATVSEIAADESSEVLAREGIEVVLGRAVICGPSHVEVDGRTIRAAKMVLCTGSGPVVPAIPGIGEVEVLTNENLFELEARPEHLAILGGGAIGCEMAQAFHRLGSQVTVIESLDRLLSKEEPSASQVLLEVFEKQGIRVLLGEKVTGVARVGAEVRIDTDSGPVTASHLLVSTGRRPASDALGALDLKTNDRGAIVVDRRMRTSVKNVYAAGDVTGRAPFTHAADEMGRVAAQNALGTLPLRFAEHAVPWVTFTDPEVARVGLTEAEAAERHPGSRVVELPMAEFDRARTSGRTEGFVKVIVGPRRLLRNAGGGRVLGATIVAERAGEMLTEVTLALRTRMFVGRLAQTSHPYPSWSVAVQQAVAQLYGVGERRPRKAQP